MRFALVSRSRSLRSARRSLGRSANHEAVLLFRVGQRGGTYVRAAPWEAARIAAGAMLILCEFADSARLGSARLGNTFAYSRRAARSRSRDKTDGPRQRGAADRRAFARERREQSSSLSCEDEGENISIGSDRK